MKEGFAALSEKIDKTAAEGRALIERSATEGRTFSYRLFASTGAALAVFVGYQQLEDHKREERLGRMESFIFKKSSAKKLETVFIHRLFQLERRHLGNKY
jgi:hypothetical protein